MIVTFHGEKLKGTFSLVKLRDKNWLLIKKKDWYATTTDITKKDRSVVSKKQLETYLKQYEAWKKEAKKAKSKAALPKQSKRPLSKTRPRKTQRTVRL